MIESKYHGTSQTAKKPKTAIVPTRSEDYPQWYQEVIKAADLAETISSKGVHGHQTVGIWPLGKYSKGS